MNSTEHKIRKIYRYSKLSYVFDVYSECEYRANVTQEEYEGLQLGEFRFDYKSWENRLGYSHKQMVRAIKELTENNIVIIQTFKGIKGTSSKYFLKRFQEQKKAQNEEQNKEQKKISDIGKVESIEEQIKEQNGEQKEIHTSLYNISNNRYINFCREIIKIYPGRKRKSVRDKELPKILTQYSEDEIIRCISRYAEEVKGVHNKQYILHESTFWKGGYIDYLDCNYEEMQEQKEKKQIKDMF